MKAMRMSLKNYLAIFSLFLLLLMPASAMSQSREAIKNSAKAWALQAVLQSLTFNHANYKARIAQNKGYFTEKGCKSFLAMLENYEFDERVLESRSVMTAALWNRRMNADALEQIYIDDEHTKDGIYKWRMDVPVKLFLKKGSMVTPYNYLATVEVQRRSNGGFAIVRWLTKLKTIGMQPEGYKEYNYKKPRPECEGLPDN
jgi:hypothetical protein